MRDSLLDDSILQVLYQLGGIVHLFAHKSNRQTPTSSCGRWPCGSVKNANDGFKFTPSSQSWNALNSFHKFCEACRGKVYLGDV